MPPARRLVACLSALWRAAADKRDGCYVLNGGKMGVTNGAIAGERNFVLPLERRTAPLLPADCSPASKHCCCFPPARHLHRVCPDSDR